MRDIIDCTITLLYFLIILVLGLYVAQKPKKTSLKEYALADQMIPWWAVLGSIIAAETSAATFLGAPTESYKTGSFVYCQFALGMILARIIVSQVFIKLYYTYNVVSIYEFLKIRFGPASKNAASFIFIIGRLLGIGVRLYLGGVIFVVIWRYYFKTEPHLFQYCLGILSILALTSLYTTIGGMRAVVYTDLFQAILMITGSLFSVVFLFLNLPHGWETLGQQLHGFENVHFVQMGLSSPLFENPYTIFAALIGMTCLTMATHGTDQDMVQRMLTAKNQRESRLALILSGVVDLPVAIVFAAIGILLLVHYTLNPDPLLPKPLNEIFAYYIVNELPRGVRGLVVAGVLATIMGSTSAALNSLAVSITKDWYKPYLNPSAEEKDLTHFAKKATVFCSFLLALIAVGTAILVHERPTLTIVPMALGLMGITYGSLLGVFLLGALSKNRGRDKTNVMAMGLGILSVLFFGKIEILGFNFGALMPARWPTPSWPWYTCIGCLTTFSLAFLFSKPKEAR